MNHLSLFPILSLPFPLAILQESLFFQNGQDLVTEECFPVRYQSYMTKAPHQVVAEVAAEEVLVAMEAYLEVAVEVGEGDVKD